MPLPDPSPGSGGKGLIPFGASSPQPWTRVDATDNDMTQMIISMAVSEISWIFGSNVGLSVGLRYDTIAEFNVDAKAEYTA